MKRSGLNWRYGKASILLPSITTAALILIGVASLMAGRVFDQLFIVTFLLWFLTLLAGAIFAAVSLLRREAIPGYALSGLVLNTGVLSAVLWVAWSKMIYLPV